MTLTSHAFQSTRGKTFDAFLPKIKNTTICYNVSRGVVYISLYRKITLRKFDLAPTSIHFVAKAEEGDDTNEYAYRLLSRSRPLLITEAIIEIGVHLSD